MEYKVWYNYLLFKLGKRKVLPKKIINNVRVRECGEKLVVVDDKKIIIDKRMKKPVYLRESVYSKLCELDKMIKKDGYKILWADEFEGSKLNNKIWLYDAYRSLDEQKKSWEKRIKETRKLYPNVSEDEVIRITTLKVANPTDGVGGHQTGGAIDITLVDKNGYELDMGSRYEEHIEQTKSYSKNLSEEQKKNRNYLFDKMRELDFVNFPMEWWHFSYGDKMWAAYKGLKDCCYGYIEVDK